MIDLLLVAPIAVPGLHPDAVRVARRAEALAHWRGGTLLSPHGPNGPHLATGLRHMDVRVAHTASPEDRLKATLAALEVEIARMRPRWVHVFDVHLMPPVLAQAWRGMKVIVEPGLPASTRLREREPRLSHEHLDALTMHEDRTMVQAEVIIARTTAEANTLVRRGARPKDVWTLRDGPLPTPAPTPAPDLPHLVYVGDVNDKSGWSLLLDALLQAGRGWRATLILDQGPPELVAQAVQARRLEDRVTLVRLGPDVATRVAAARLVICPARLVGSLRAGTWIPLAVSWAVSCARPLIAPDVAVVHDAGGPGVAGFPPDDSTGLAAVIRRLLDRPSEYAALAQAAAHHRRQLSWDGAAVSARALWTRALGLA